jgi:hypothetical protein
MALTTICRQLRTETCFLPYIPNLFCGSAKDLMAMFDTCFITAQVASVTSLWFVTCEDFTFPELRRLL